MRRLLTILFLLGAPAAMAQGFRIGDAQSVSSSLTTPGVISTLQATINICTSPANAVPCTNKATTYTDVTLGTPCATSAQVVLAGTSTCVAGTDSRGNWGAWVASGNYDYTITVFTGQSFGPYTISAGPLSVPFSALTAAQATNTIANGNYAQAWNWTFSGTNTTGLALGEGAASSGSGNVLFALSTAAGSLTSPFTITQGSGAAGTGANLFNFAGGSGFNCVTATCNGGNAGGAYINTGQGGNAGVTLGLGGHGGDITFVASNGGNASGNNKSGGRGGIFAIEASNGGNSTSGNASGGQGGDIQLETGAGGTGSGTGTNARGGNLNVTLGAPGTGGSGTAGAPGQVNLTFDTVGGNLASCFLCMTGTWNTTGVPDAAILVNITNTASGSGAKLLDLQVGGTPQFTVDKGGNVAAVGEVTAASHGTATNCAAKGSAASPSIAACGSASAGHFSCDPMATGATCQVNTTAVTAHSEIFVFESDTSATGTELGVTCNTSTTVIPTHLILASYVAATNFTINLGTVTTNPACFSYFIVN